MKNLFLILLTIGSSTLLIGQQTTQRIYREIGGIGFGNTSFRDMATSPLIYEGSAFNITSGKWKVTDTKETYFGSELLLSMNTANAGEEESNSFLMGTSFNYAQLFQLKRFSKNGWDYKVGGKLDVLMLFRGNLALSNNAIGFEAFPTLFGAFKVSKNFTRHPLLQRKKESQRQQLSFSLDVGMLNNTFRNGFAYTNHAPFYNDKNIFKDHQFNWLTGFRIKSSIAYILYSNKNSNAWKVAYNWTGTHSGKSGDKFALSTGILQFSLLHRLN